MDISFEQYLKLIDAEAHKHGFQGSYTDQTGPDCWETQYQHGMTPAETFAEELSEWTE